MDAFAFADLCRDASRALGVADLDELAREGQITLDGVEVELVFDEEGASRLFCYVDVGSAESLASAVDGVAVYRDMLTLNLLRGSKAAGAIALDPDSNHFVLSTHLLDPDAYDGERLAVTLKEQATDGVFARHLWAARLEHHDATMPSSQLINLA